MNKARIARFLRELGIEGAEVVRRLPYSSNDDPDRQLYVAGDKAIVKAYGRADFDCYEIESALGPVIAQKGIWAPEVLGHGVFGDEAYLAFSFVSGPVLNEVYQQFSFDEYCGMIRSLGAAMRSFHEVRVEGIRNLPFVDQHSPNHVLRSRRRWECFETSSDGLVDVGFLSNEGKREVSEFLESTSGRAFASEEVLNHCDIHNQNLMLDDQNSERPISIIDWETASLQPKELDFVHPFLNILGEGFSGRRLFRAESTRGKNNFLRSFESGYGDEVDWGIVVSHCVLWYLEEALKAHKNGEEGLRDFFLRTGLGTLEFIGKSPLDELTDL